MSSYRPVLLAAAGLLLAAWPAGGSFAAPVKRAVKGPAAAAKPAPKPAAGAPAATDAAAIAAVEKLGGRVQEVAQNDNHLEVSYHLSGASVTDASLVPLARLKKIVHLDLGQTGITDAGLAHVRGLTELTDLHLEGTKVTDRGLASLKGLVNLTYLNLYGTAVTDAGLDQPDRADEAAPHLRLADQSHRRRREQAEEGAAAARGGHRDRPDARPGTAQGGPGRAEVMPREVRWERMFPDELEQAFAACPVVYFAYGLCEPHGPQNAVGSTR